MGAVEVVGVAASLSLLAGWRLYAAVLAAGLAMRAGWIELPERLATLDALASPWVIGAAALGATAELLADKVAFVDSVWDAVHTAIRPVGGALLALAVVDATDPAWQVATLLLGGGGALAAHTAKASTRALVNTSPEPFSNIAVSAGEDVATGGALYVALAHPEAAIAVAALVALVVAGLIWASWRALHRVRLWWRRTMPPA